MSEQMDRKDSFCPGSYMRLNLMHIDIESVRIDIDKDRNGAGIENRFGRSKEGKRRCDHFIAFADAQCVDCQMKGVSS
jgi:hypothetical protein